MSLFRVEKGNFKRKECVILDQIDFEIHNGEILGILGCNGVGKTTLIQCCLGFLQWNSGKSYLQNKEISQFSPKELFSKIAYIPQAKNLNVALSVLDMVVLGLNTAVNLIPKKEHKEKAEIALENVGIPHLKTKQCDCLSGGELQMVIFARALVNDPVMVILDEPESNLDFKNQQKVLEILESLKHKQKGIILNTHYPQNAKKLADKILILHKNKPHLLGDKSLVNKRQLGESFEVEESFFDYLVGI